MCAQAWLDDIAHFETEYCEVIAPATTVYHTGNTARHDSSIGSVHGDNSFGIEFSRPIEASDTVETLQTACVGMYIKTLQVPDLEQPGWRILAHGNNTKRQGSVTITGFQNWILDWTLAPGSLCKIEGCEQYSSRAGNSDSDAAQWTVERDFEGVLHFQCQIVGIDEQSCANPPPIQHLDCQTDAHLADLQAAIAERDDKIAKLEARILGFMQAVEREEEFDEAVGTESDEEIIVYQDRVQVVESWEGQEGVPPS